MAKKKPAEHHEEHADETWLIPYSDLLTLLLALFIVLFATAQVDSKKFEVLAQSFNAAFNGGPSVMNQMSIAGDVNPNTPTQDPGQEKLKEQVKEAVQLNDVKKKVDAYIAQNNLGGQLQTVLTEEGLMIRIQDTALFASGRAELRPDSQRWGGEIAKLLATLPQHVIISGHTDNLPINTAEFPSNWDLSSKRALNFMKFLLAQDVKLDPARFSAIGYGEYRPILGNDTEDGRAKNRRVEVLIMKRYR
ncbi:MAG: flagellar motor protein MotB [Sporomusaceae bacterium]|nr:flagellar motor protein MotB [Sporomusaceae bacterium]